MSLPASTGACLLAALVVVPACSKGPVTPTGAVVELSGNLAFGNVTVGQKVSAVMTIKNSGATPLTVTGMTVPSGTSEAYTASWTQGVIAVGASQAVTIFFAPVSAKAYSGTLNVNGDQPGGTSSIAISGTGVADLSPLTITDVAPSMAKTLASVVIRALETSALASNRSGASPAFARLLDFFLPTVHATNVTAACPVGGSARIEGMQVAGSQYTLTGSTLTLANCEWTVPGRKNAVVVGAVFLGGRWCVAGSPTCPGGSMPATIGNGSVSVTDAGSALIGGSFGLEAYAISIGGAGLQQGTPDTPPPPSPNTCPAVVTPGATTVAAGAGGLTQNVVTGAVCPWTASSGSGFITVVQSSGRGPGAATFNVAANTGAQRTGTVTVAGQSFVITQAGSGLNLAGTWTYTCSGCSGGTQVVFTQSPTGVVTGTGTGLQPGESLVFNGTVSGNSVTSLAAVSRLNVPGIGLCNATSPHTTTQASSAQMTGTYTFSGSCTVVSPEGSIVVPFNGNGTFRFTKP